MALLPQQGPYSLARVQVELVEAVADPMKNPDLETLRRQIPSARGLPLLQALASGRAQRVVLEYLEPLSLAVTIQPCR